MAIISLRTYFNPRSPRGERQGRKGLPSLTHDFNPRSPRGERLESRHHGLFFPGISIHAPLAGSDRSADYRGNELHTFQSTLPSRGATLLRFRGWRSPRNFNPRSPRGERRHHLRVCIRSFHFNPRSPRGERLTWADVAGLTANFNPRSPRGERPDLSLIGTFSKTISIHAPLAGSDST